MSDGAKCIVALGVIFGYVAVSLIIMWVSNVVSGYKESTMEQADRAAECFMWPIYLLLVPMAAVWLMLVKPVVVLARLVVDMYPRLRVLRLPFHSFELGQWLRYARDRRLRNRTKEGGNNAD